MTHAAAAPEPTLSGASTAPGSAPLLTRWFGWAMLAALVAFLINMQLTIRGGWPGVVSLFEAPSARAALQLSFYVIGAVLAWVLVRRHRELSLRADGARIARFNAWLIRAAFFSVLFIGLVDAGISFLRVEELLEAVVGEDMTRNLGRANWRGTWVHMPLLALGILMALVTRTLGFTWLTLMIVTAELLIVITRFVFSYEQAFMGDLVRFWYASLFLFASAYTLQHEGHVRVDVFYAGFERRTKGWINAFGSVLLGMTLCWTILIVGLGSRSSIIYAPIRSFETSQSGYGMYVKYLMAGFLAVFAISMLIQFVSYLMFAVADIVDEDSEQPLGHPRDQASEQAAVEMAPPAKHDDSVSVG